MVYEFILTTWQEHKLKQNPCKTLFIACLYIFLCIYIYMHVLKLLHGIDVSLYWSMMMYDHAWMQEKHFATFYRDISHTTLIQGKAKPCTEAQ